MRAIPGIAYDFVRDAEAERLTSYLDSGGVWTIGIGHTGPEVVKGLTITKRQSEIYLKEDMGIAARKLNARVNASVIAELTDHQYAALISFVLNLGAKVGWTIWKVLNARNFDAVPGQLIRFVYDQDPKTGKLRKVAGLVNRRTAEIRLWSTNEPGSVDEHPSSAVTRFAETPPAPAEAGKPLVKSKTMWTSAAVAVGGCVEGARQVQALVAPQAAYSDYLANVGGVVAAVIVAGSVAIMVFKWLDNRKARS
jgi:lysozyme